MINKKLKILVSASPFCEHDLKPINILKKNNIHYDLNPKGRKLTENEITNIIEKYDGLIADVETLNMKVLSKAKNLKIISRVGIGVNNIDLKFAKKKKDNYIQYSRRSNSSCSRIKFELNICAYKKCCNSQYRAEER